MVWRRAGREGGGGATDSRAGLVLCWGRCASGEKHDGVAPWCAAGVVPIPIAVAAALGRDRVGGVGLLAPMPNFDGF